MISNNLFRHPKSKPRSYRFLGCEKWFKDSLQIRGRNPHAIISNRSANSCYSLTSILVSVSNSDVNCAIETDRINAIAQQIGENLAQFTSQPDNLSFSIEVQGKVDSLIVCFRRKH